jgi:hypothetical protein
LSDLIKWGYQVVLPDLNPPFELLVDIAPRSLPVISVADYGISIPADHRIEPTARGLRQVGE